MRGILRTGRVAISFFALAALGALPHCSASEEAAESGDAVVDLPETGVKSQALGNCWAYTTAGWIESMRKANGSDGGDVAEVYWTYWWWFEQIHDANRKDSYPCLLY